jgi:signal transduction histidine kinase
MMTIHARRAADPALYDQPRADSPVVRPAMPSPAEDDIQAAVEIVVSLLVAAVRVDAAAFIEVAPSPEVPVRVVAGSMPDEDLEWLGRKAHLSKQHDSECVRFQTRPPRLATFLLLPVGGRMGAVLVARQERAGNVSAANRRVAGLIRDCLGRVLAAEQVADAMSTSLIVGEEVFRTRLAAELHDDVGQRLSALLIESRRLQNTLLQSTTGPLYDAATWIHKQLKECNEVVRDLVYETSAPALSEFGLPAAVRDLAERQQARNAITISYSCDFANTDSGLSYDVLPRPVQVACLRIIQEAVTNVIKHANARHCAITLTLSDTMLAATIEDDGCGRRGNAASDGFGIIGMRERAAVLGGRVTLEAGPDEGTVVHADLPLVDVDGIASTLP